MYRDVAAIEALFAQPFNDLMYQAQTVHRRHFDPNAVQLSTLLSIKTGGCSEDCGYCSQSARFHTGLEARPLMALDDVVEAAKAAKAKGATRFCMGAAWRGPKDKDLEQVTEMIRAVKALGMETCATLGQLKDGQAQALAAAGLDYYNHNLDTSRAHYDNVVHTHSYDDRLNTLSKVRHAGMKVCCGGIMGMGESRHDRAAFPRRTCGARSAAGDPCRSTCWCISRAHRSKMRPRSNRSNSCAPSRSRASCCRPRSCACPPGAQPMPDYLQALCFLAGANSIFYGDQLLTTPNPGADADRALFEKLGLHPLEPEGAGETPRAVQRPVNPSPRADAPRVRPWVPAQTELQTPSFPDRPARRSPGGSRRRPCPGPRAAFPSP